MAFLVGGISLAGFPLSLGFAARWGLYRVLAMTSLSNALLALASTAAVMLGVVSSMRVLLVQTSGQRLGDATAVSRGSGEDRVVVILIVALLVATLALGFFPNIASGIATEMARWYTFFK